MKKTLITGVAGFIGSNMAKELLKKGYYVIGMDNLSQGFKRNLEGISRDKNFKFFEKDVRDVAAVMELSEGAGTIVHLAAFKIPRYGNAMDTLKINTKGTENVLEAAKANNCKVVFSSTSDIYGKNPAVPFSEENDIVLGQTNVKRWSYAVSKVYDEHLCFAYLEEYKVPVTIVRYFGGYGPNQNLTWWGGPQSVFIECAFKKKPIPIHGNGKQTRSFTYVKDIITGTIAALENEKAVGEAFNIGNKREIAIIDLAKMIWVMINPKEKPVIDFISYESFSGKYEDVSRRVPEDKKAKEILGFEAKVELEEGLPITIEWQRSILPTKK